MTEVTHGAGRDGSTPVPSDVELLEGIRAGDPRALEALMARYWPPLVRYAGNVMSGVGDPQDVVQEGFVRLWARRENWGLEGSLKALLYTIVRNAALDERRRRDRGDRVTREHVDCGAPNPTPYENVQGAELERAPRPQPSPLSHRSGKRSSVLPERRVFPTGRSAPQWGSPPKPWRTR